MDLHLDPNVLWMTCIESKSIDRPQHSPVVFLGSWKEYIERFTNSVRTPHNLDSGTNYSYPLVMTNIAMENGPFIDGLHGYIYKKW